MIHVKFFGSIVQPIILKIGYITKNCQYITKKYSIICIVKKGKCGDYEELSSKCTINSNNFFIKIKTILIKAMNMLCQALFFSLA